MKYVFDKTENGQVLELLSIRCQFTRDMFNEEKVVETAPTSLTDSVRPFCRNDMGEVCI
jgi:hypothetical protein